jgi:hypothetical protein
MFENEEHVMNAFHTKRRLCGRRRSDTVGIRRLPLAVAVAGTALALGAPAGYGQTSSALPGEVQTPAAVRDAAPDFPRTTPGDPRREETNPRTAPNAGARDSEEARRARQSLPPIAEGTGPSSSTIWSLANARPRAGSTEAADAELPAEERQGPVSFRSGGIGEDEDDAFRAMAPGYPLALEFVAIARPGNAHLADVRVAIAGAGGERVLDTVADGPWLLVRLPPGRYRVTAESQGISQTRPVEVSATGNRRLVFTWEAAG